MILALVVCCSLLAYWKGTKTHRSARPSPENQSGLVTDPLRLNFGEVWEHPQFEWDLPLTNTTDQAVEVTRFSSSCSCSAIKPKAMLLLAGEKRNIRLTLDLTAKRSQEVRDPVRDFEISLRPEIRGGFRHPGWTLRGRVRTALSLSERRIDFGEDLVAGQHFPPHTVKIKGLVPLAYLEAGCDDAFIDTRTTRDENSSSVFNLEIKLKPSMPAGKFTRHVRIQAVTKDGKKLAMAWLPVEGKIGADVQPIPGAVHFGAAPLGSVMRETVGIRSYSGRAIEVDAIELPPNSGLSVAPVAEGKKAELRCVVTQRIQAQGHHATVWKVRVRVSGGEKMVIPVQVSYYGVGKEKWL